MKVVGNWGKVQCWREQLQLLDIKVILKLQCFKVIIHTQINQNNSVPCTESSRPSLWQHRPGVVALKLFLGLHNPAAAAASTCALAALFSSCTGFYTNSHAVRNGRLQWACKIFTGLRVQNLKDRRPRLCWVCSAFLFTANLPPWHSEPPEATLAREMLGSLVIHRRGNSVEGKSGQQRFSK